MRWRIALSCVAAVLLALGPVRGATLQQDYLDIYLKLNDSERLERSGDIRGALEGFEDCYNRLRKIHDQNPDWERVLVTSRMEDCRAKIAELEPKVDEGVPPSPVAPETPGEPPTVTSLEDTATLKARLQDVENQLATTKQQLADVSEKYKNSEMEVQMLHAQLDGVNQQLATLRSTQSVDQNMGQLMAQNKALTDKLATAQAQVKALAGSPNSRASKLIAQLKAVQEKLDETQMANQGLTETTNTLQSQLNQAQNDLAAANQKLAAAGPGSPDYLTLKRENEVMRDILTHEIQEQSRRDGAKRIAQEEFDRLKINSQVLQEQLDILGSPMAPPANDEERSLLASLKAGNGGVMPLGGDTSGNQFSATTGGNTITENNVPAPSTNAIPSTTDTNGVTATPAASPGSTNALTETPAPATNATPAATDTNTAAAETNAAPAPTLPVATDTNAPAAATNAAPGVAADTNTAPATNAIPEPAGAPASATPPVSATNAVAAETNAIPAPAPATNAAPVATDTNAAPAAATNSVAATDTNAPASSPATTDNGTTGTDQHVADPTRYSYKPRLPDDMREVAQEATDLFKMQRYDEAAAKYQMIIDKYPESLYAWSNLGVVRSQEGKLQEAMKALQQAVKLSPNDAFSYRNLGIVYYQLNQNDAAIDALERSIALDPNNVYSHDYLGCACSQKGWQEVAEKEFRKAIEINDDFPDAHYNLAIVYAMQKPPSLELARKHYKRALELGLPRDPRLEKLLGI
jgi:Flp pilus assembly protein TadD